MDLLKQRTHPSSRKMTEIFSVIALHHKFRRAQEANCSKVMVGIHNRRRLITKSNVLGSTIPYAVYIHLNTSSSLFCQLLHCCIGIICNFKWFRGIYWMFFDLMRSQNIFSRLFVVFVLWWASSFWIFWTVTSVQLGGVHNYWQDALLLDTGARSWACTL